MPELSKLNFEGKEYDLKDAVARNKIITEGAVQVEPTGDFAELLLSKQDSSTPISVDIPVAGENGATCGFISSSDKANIDELMKKTFPLVATLNITPTALQEKGSSCNVTLTWSTKIDGTDVTPTALSINGTSVLGQSSKSFVATDTTTYTLSATAKGRTTSASKTITFVYPIYTGYNANTAIGTGSWVESGLTKMALRSSLGGVTDTKNNDSTSKYYWIITPYKVNSITTSGINITSDFETGTFTFKGTNYHWYRLSKASAIGSFSFVLS